MEIELELEDELYQQLEHYQAQQQAVGRLLTIEEVLIELLEQGLAAANQPALE